ncbi:MAG: hypothetical protein N2747_00260 [Chitinophagaceae bacterium]|nr:hypothetical protein [Chitinophagaceae bacterium]
MHRCYQLFNERIGIEAKYIYVGRSSKLSIPESLQLCSYDSLNYRIKNGYIKVLRPSGRNQSLLLDFETLPDQWKKLCIERFGNPESPVKKSLFQEYYKKDQEAYLYYLGYKKTNGKRLTNEQIEQYTLNASCLNTLNRLYNVSTSLRRSLRAGIGPIKAINGKTYPSCWQIAVAELNRIRDIIPHTLPEHEDSLRKLLKKYKQQGYKALLSGKLGNMNRRKVDDAVIELLNALFAGQHYKPTYSDVVKTYHAFKSGYIEILKNDDSGECYDPKDYPEISEATIYRYLSSWYNRVGNEHKRPNNRQVLVCKYITPHSFTRPKYAGSIISVDDRQPPFAYIDRNGNRQRLWAYMAIDLASEAFTTWVFGESKEGIILDFYRQMIRNYHQWGVSLPAEIEGEISLNSKYVESFLKEGELFQFTHFSANNARSKRIERYFRDLRYNIEKIRQGWLARPVGMSEANSWNDEERIPTLPKEQIIRQCLADIEAWNNSPHSVIEGKTRWEVFIEQQNPKLLPINYHAALKYLGYETRTSCNAGQIRLNNGMYLLGMNGKPSLGEELIHYMEQIEGREITVRWIDNEDGSVMAAQVYKDGVYICDAVPKPLYSRARIERGPEDRHLQQVMCAYVATITKFIKDKKNAVQNITIIQHTEEPKRRKHVFKILCSEEGVEETREVIGKTPPHEPKQEYKFDYNLAEKF